jgi:beta-galactosidase
MYYGGTNLGDMTGGNGDVLVDWFTPDPTSYDYDAPLSEAGDVTWKYWKILDLIKKYRTDIPKYDVVNSTKKSYQDVKLTESVALLDVLDIVAEKKTHPTPTSFEELNCPFCWVLYETKIKKPGLMTGYMHDRAVMIHSGKITKELLRPSEVQDVVNEGDVVQFLVEGMGRSNWGPDFFMDKKGLHDMQITGEALLDWTIWAMPLSNLTGLPFKSGTSVGQPMFYRGTFNVDELGDTYLNPTGLRRGVAYINGINIGRYWTVGPQLTLYVRKEYLKKGVNEVVIFESGSIEKVPDLKMEDHATIDMKPTPLHRYVNEGRRGGRRM